MRNHTTVTAHVDQQPAAVVTRLPVAFGELMTSAGFAGLLVVDLHLPWAQSLKDKRQPLRSIRQRLRDAGFSVSEVDFHDKWQRSQVAISIVGRSSNDVEGMLDNAQRMLESRPELEVSVRQRTVLAIDEYD